MCNFSRPDGYGCVTVVQPQLLHRHRNQCHQLHAISGRILHSILHIKQEYWQGHVLIGIVFMQQVNGFHKFSFKCHCTIKPGFCCLQCNEYLPTVVYSANFGTHVLGKNCLVWSAEHVLVLTI
jgi:hypothetical protein